MEVKKFLLEYEPDQGPAGTISFDISAASVESNLNANLQLGLVAYGINAINTTIPLCDILGGVLCPLPQYDFVGSATIPLPTSLAGTIHIPGAAYWIPDLEATAYVRLLRVSDGSEAACLRVDLANGKTTRWASVSWALGGLAIGCVLLSALWFLVGTLVYPAASLSSTTSPTDPNAAWASLGRRKERLFLLMSLLQFVATTGLLSIDYPIIYEAFTSNFAWSLGLIRETPVVHAIDNLRARTGGNLTQLAGRSGLVGGTEALKSIYSRSSVVYPSAGEIATTLLEEIGHSLSSKSASTPSPARRAFDLLSSISTVHLARRQFGNPMSGVPSTNPSQAVAVPDVQETNTLTAVHYGIPHFLVNLDISPFDGYLLVFINFLFLCCIAIALAILGGLVWALIRLVQRRSRARRAARNGYSGEQAKVGYEDKRRTASGCFGALRRRTSGTFATLLRAGTLRLLLIAWYPLLVFTFFQWTLGSSDSYAPIVLSVFTSVLTTLALFILAIRFFFLARRALRPRLTSVEDTLAPYGETEVLASPFRPAPAAPPVTTNPNPKRALRKAERQDIETFAVGQFLARGLAPYSPFWNAYKVRSRRATAQKRNWWKGRGWWFGLVELLLVPLVTALFVGFAHRSGWTQTVALVTIQGLVFLATCIWTPYEDKSLNATRILWAICRILIAGALVAFNPSIGLNEIVRVAIGAVLAVIISVLVILFFILLLIDFVQLCVFTVRGVKDRRRHRGLNSDGPTTVNAALPQMEERMAARDDSITEHEGLGRPHTTHSGSTLANFDSPSGQPIEGGAPVVTKTVTP
ncbi:DUF907 domain protein [Rhodotorula toruloides]|uniref:DUF907 domain protein n=1 Tax=Rhodotorula toruloides TaxID=5286 RepID=A0A511KC13_RHOTO|nr:DUF907 domain protein [Rhodotorula toruloides]